MPICPRGHYGVGQKKKRGSVGAAEADTNSLAPILLLLILGDNGNLGDDAEKLRYYGDEE